LKIEEAEKAAVVGKMTDKNSRDFWGDFIAQHYDIENKRASVA